jgi:hypothetical protein
MRLTIIKDDSAVIIGNIYYEIDVSALPSGFHALQWYETWGEIEWKDENGKMTGNERIESLNDYQWIIDVCNTKNEEQKVSSLNKFL